MAVRWSRKWSRSTKTRSSKQFQKPAEEPETAVPPHFVYEKPNNEYGVNIDEYFVDIVNIENGFEKPSLFQKAVEYVHNEQK